MGCDLSRLPSNQERSLWVECAWPIGSMFSSRPRYASGGMMTGERWWVSSRGRSHYRENVGRADPSEPGRPPIASRAIRVKGLLRQRPEVLYARIVSDVC